MPKRRKRVTRPPAETPGTLAEHGVRASLQEVATNLFPGSGALITLLGRWFPSILEKRASAWANELQRAVNELDRHLGQVEAEQLRQNEDFANFALDATQAAMRTHLGSKRELLRNAIINAALDGAPAVAKGRAFLRMVDEFDELHVALLDLMADPAGWFAKKGQEPPKHQGHTGMEFDIRTSQASFESLIESAFRDHASKDLIEVILEELQRRRLIVDEALNDAYCGPGDSLATELGHQFLRFIAAPPDAPANEDAGCGESR